MTGNIGWYVRWKIFLFRKSAFHAVRSPNTVMVVFLMYVAFAFWLGDRTAILVALAFFLGFWIYMDYRRGIPSKWKRNRIVLDYRRKEEEKRRREISETQRTGMS